MNVNPNHLEVNHNEIDHTFEVWIDGHLSKLDYLLDGNTIVMTHVGVYPEHRGQGVAGKLTQVALEYAKENSLRVIPMCPYIATYIHRNPHYIQLTKQQMNE